jgi:hypothetical protein
MKEYELYFQGCNDASPTLRTKDTILSGILAYMRGYSTRFFCFHFKRSSIDLKVKDIKFVNGEFSREVYEEGEYDPNKVWGTFTIKEVKA